MRVIFKSHETINGNSLLLNYIIIKQVELKKNLESNSLTTHIHLTDQSKEERIERKINN